MKRLLCSAFFILIATLFTQAQKINNMQAGAKGMHPSFIEFSSTDAPLFRKGNVIVVKEDNLRTTLEPNTLFVQSEKDELGFEHYRYQQTFNGIPVEDAMYVMHVKGGKVISENGNWIKEFSPSASKTASISEATALSSAMQQINARIYKWQDADEEAFLKKESGDAAATFFPKAQLVYYAAGDLSPQNLRLAYKFDIYSKEPLSRQYIYIDARTGTVLGTKELIHTGDAEGKATTVFSAAQTIKTSLSNGVYTLRESSSRGKGIVTLNLQQKTNYSQAVDFTDADNNWNNVNAKKDQYATDAHWGAEKTYDFYFQNFKRNGIDGKGYAIKSYVHYSTNYFNAFWDGTRMTYGDGNSTDGFKPLTSLDICAHEITHGLTSFTACLNYSKESGALNEGFSDIFGTAVEWFARPSKKDWLIGSDFYVIRSMSNPNAYSQPDTYKGIYWYTGTGDNGGVHTNSGVLNYWFYLLSNGGSGTNDKGYKFNVSGISITKAQAIAYRTLTTYLVPTSVYTDARKYSIKAAQDLYGANSNEAAQTSKAWDAVGVTATTISGFTADTNTNTIMTGIASGIKVSKLYPNPTQGKLVIEYDDIKNTDRTIAIFDLSGNLIFNQHITSVKGNNRVEINLSSLVNGNYMLRVDNVQSGMFSVKH